MNDGQKKRKRKRKKLKKPPALGIKVSDAVITQDKVGNG